MFMHPHRLIAGAHGGKFCLAHGVKRALCRWPDGGINGFPRGVFPLQHHRIIPVTKYRRQGNNALAGFCGRGGFSLAGAVQVTVGGEDNLTGRVFLTGQARQRRKVHGRQRHHDGFPGQVMHGKGRRIALRYPQAFSGLFLPLNDMPLLLRRLSGCV